MPQIALPYFNLLDEEWIPAVMRDGERKKLGLLELFRRADAVRVVEHPSPLATAALHRLLLAVLYRSLTPKDGDGVADWFADGWPAEKITGYLGKWRERFYLFHEAHPFWQVADLDVDEKERKSWSVLAAEHNASSGEGAKILFDHPCQESPLDSSVANVACWLVATQIFALPGGRGYSPAPSSSALFVFSVGSNLRETLLLNLPPSRTNDIPVWENDAETMASLKPRDFPHGYVNLYTWRSRAVRLYSENMEAVSQIGFKPGTGLDKVNIPNLRDPMIAYNDNGLPVQAKQRGLWRDFDSLLPYRNSTNTGSSSAPQVIENTVELCRNLELPSQSLSVMICCQVNDNAKIECWRMERFVLPMAILNAANDVRGTIRILLNRAEDWQSHLYKACKVFATECIRRNADRQPAAEDIKKVVEQMPCTAVYWNHLEHAFKQNLEHGFTDPEQAQKLWRGKIRDALALAWDAQRNAVGDGDAWTIRAMTKAGGIVGKAIKELNDLLKEEQGENAAGKGA